MEKLAKEHYGYDPLTKFLRKDGLLIKNIWPNAEPSQEEINMVIAAVEGAVNYLKQKYQSTIL